jgi:hypothetical protein
MKKKDFLVIFIVIILLLPFFLFDCVYDGYEWFNRTHPLIMSFLKFGILATFGECIGLRITQKVWNRRRFGIIPRAIVWGILGMGISMAMTIFSSGVPAFLEKMGLQNATQIIKADFSCLKILIAFCISVAMNTIFAPVFMTLHKITDTHILNNGGTLRGLFCPLKMEQIISTLDWKRQWNFVFKKTIPLFWYPAHTITFLLPQQFQVLFAAILGVVLGLLLAIASLKTTPTNRR